VTATSKPEATAPEPAEFRAAIGSLLSAHPRPEIVLEEVPAPRRLAPHAHALTADLEIDDTELATGRLVLLHDPAGHDAWNGTFRVVTYVRAELEPEVGADPMVLEVAWTWLTDALSGHGAEYTAISGTATRVASQSFGVMADQPSTAHIEVRASWTPLTTELSSHLLAWTEALSMAAGVPPLPDGVTAFSRRRSQSGP